jgi:hypothetical protein
MSQRDSTVANGTKYWRRFSGQRLLNLIIAVSAIAISYEGMSQGIMGAVVVAPEFAVCIRSFDPPCEQSAD